MIEKSVKEMSLTEIENQIRDHEKQDLTSDGAKLYLEVLREAREKRKGNRET